MKHRQSIIIGLLLLGIVVVAAGPFTYQEGRKTWLAHSLMNLIRQGEYSRHPEDDIAELVTEIEAIGGERRSLNAILPLIKSSDPHVAEWAVHAAMAFHSTTPEILDGLIEIYSDSSRPLKERKNAAYAFAYIDPVAAKKLGVSQENLDDAAPLD